MGATLPSGAIATNQAAGDRGEGSPMNRKRIALAIAILCTAGDAALAFTGVLSPSWAAVLAVVGAGAYGIARTLQKTRECGSLKSVLSCTETWGAALAWAGTAVSAMLGVVPPEKAGALLVASAVLTGVLRRVQVAKLGPLTEPASELPTKPTLVPRDLQKGSWQVCSFVLLVAAIAVGTIGVAIALMFALPGGQ